MNRLTRKLLLGGVLITFMTLIGLTIWSLYKVNQDIQKPMQYIVAAVQVDSREDFAHRHIEDQLNNLLIVASRDYVKSPFVYNNAAKWRDGVMILRNALRRDVAEYALSGCAEVFPSIVDKTKKGLLTHLSKIPLKIWLVTIESWLLLIAYIWGAIVFLLLCYYWYHTLIYGLGTCTEGRCRSKINSITGYAY